MKKRNTQEQHKVLANKQQNRKQQREGEICRAKTSKKAKAAANKSIEQNRSSKAAIIAPAARRRNLKTDARNRGDLRAAAAHMNCNERTENRRETSSPAK